MYTATEGGVAVKGKDVIVVRGTQAFAIWAAAEQSAFEIQTSKIERLISSFTLREPMGTDGVSRQDSSFLLGGTILTLDPALSEGSAAGHVGSIFSGLVALDRNLNQSQSGIYIDTGLGSTANTVIPAHAGIQ